MTEKILQDIEKTYIQMEENLQHLINDVQNLSFTHPDIAPIANKLKKDLQNLKKAHSELNNYINITFL